MSLPVVSRSSVRGRAVRCHYAADIEALLDRGVIHGSRWRKGEQLTEIRQQVFVADRVLQGGSETADPAK